MKTKHIIIFIAGGALLCGFGALVLLISILLVADDSENEEAGRLTIAVRYKMFYENQIPPAVQCVQPEIGICETAAYLNRETHRIGGSSCEVQHNDPQPFLSQPEISKSEEYEFVLKPGNTYYWYVFFNNHEDCTGRLPAEYERFETGEVKLGANEKRRIEKNLTK